MGSRRVYQPWKEKHKPPAGFGTHCPTELTVEEAQDLLDKAIADEEAGGEPKLYMVSNGWIFVAQATVADKGVYHGYPVPGAEVEYRILRRLEQVGIITSREKWRLVKQKALPERYSEGP